MTAAPLPTDEAQRLAALQRYDLLDSPPEVAFDRLTALVARLLDVPIALVCVVDAERQWFKARVGLDIAETARDQAFCAHAILDDRPLIVADTHHDVRFADNDLVTKDPMIRAYLGAPLITTDGFRLGTLCAIDRRPRQFTADQVDVLRQLSAIAVDEVELRLERRRALAAAERSRRTTEEHRILFEEAPLALWTLDPAGTVLSWNHAAEQLFGWTSEEVIGGFVPTVGDDERGEYDQLARELTELKHSITTDRRRWRKDGTLLDVRLAITPLFYEDGRLRGFLTIAQDVTEDVRLRDELRRAAMIDPLTALLNRRGFEQLATREVARAVRDRSRLSLVMFDIDHFKHVNDEHGHAMGDRVLVAFARIIRENLRATDLAVRWGGEELLVLFPATEQARALATAERIRVAVAECADPGLPSFTTSAGVAEWQPGETIDVSVARADEQLYLAKETGRNRVC